MLECRDQIEHQIYWQPRIGSALFQFNNWTGLGAFYFITSPDIFCDESIQNVNEVVMAGKWDEIKLRQILLDDLASHIIDHIAPPGVQDDVDIPYWILETRGNFSVKSTWEYL